MFKDESHIISCLINRCNNKIFLKGKYIAFNFMFTKNGFNRSICYFIFKGMIFFIYWRYNMTFPYWKKVFVDAFDIWYPLNELMNTSLYFLTSFLKTGLFWLSILWTFGYELTKLFIINNIKVSCHNMTVMIIYKGIVTFITVTFNWISRSSH